MTEDYDKVEVGAVIRSHEHKTRHVCENFSEKTADQCYNREISRIFYKGDRVEETQAAVPQQTGKGNDDRQCYAQISTQQAL